MSEENSIRCPHCGKKINETQTKKYRFASWGTPVVVFIISLMLLGLDIVDDGTYNSFISEIFWSQWAILGVWLFYITVQLIRTRPLYSWLMLPIGAILFAIFFVFLDKSIGPNAGVFGLDWALFVVIPWVTFFVAIPIISRFARKQPGHEDQLETLVDTLVDQ